MPIRISLRSLGVPPLIGPRFISAAIIVTVELMPSLNPFSLASSMGSRTKVVSPKLLGGYSRYVPSFERDKAIQHRCVCQPRSVSRGKCKTPSEVVSSLPRKRESTMATVVDGLWIPACAGMTGVLHFPRKSRGCCTFPGQSGCVCFYWWTQEPGDLCGVYGPSY